MLFLAVYPVADAGRFGGGSDRDESLDVVARALLAGDLPYDARTYLGNDARQLPGAVVLALPFVVIGGDSAWQNLFWVGIVAAVGIAAPTGGALLVALAAGGLFFGAGAARELVTGGDLLANSLYLAVPIVWLLHSHRPARMFRTLASAGLIGLGLASRAHVIALVPLLGAGMVLSLGRVRGAWCLGAALLMTVATTLPVYLLDPSGFSPLTQADLLTAVAGRTGGLAVVLGTVLLSSALAWRHLRTRAPSDVILRDMALVTALPVVAVAVLQSTAAGRPVLEAAEYMLPAQAIGLGAVWQRFHRAPPLGAPQPGTAA